MGLNKKIPLGKAHNELARHIPHRSPGALIPPRGKLPSGVRGGCASAWATRTLVRSPDLSRTPVMPVDYSTGGRGISAVSWIDPRGDAIRQQAARPHPGGMGHGFPRFGDSSDLPAP